MVVVVMGGQEAALPPLGDGTSRPLAPNLPAAPIPCSAAAAPGPVGERQEVEVEGREAHTLLFLLSPLHEATEMGCDLGVRQELVLPPPGPAVPLPFGDEEWEALAAAAESGGVLPPSGRGEAGHPEYAATSVQLSTPLQ